MSARNIILIVLVVIMGAGTMLLINYWLDSREAALRAQQDQQQTEQQTQRPQHENFVLVAARPLPAGRFLRPGDLRWQAWPDDNLPDTYFQQGRVDPQTLVGAVVRQRVGNGQPISGDLVVRPGEQGFLAAALWPGMRAVSVSVNAATGVSGFVFPGDRVDLILTRSLRIERGGARATRVTSETVLENVRVIAIDQSLDQQQQAASVARTVTLELTPQQTEMVALAQQLGQLALSLRSLAPEEDREIARAAHDARQNGGQQVVLVGEDAAGTTSSGHQTDASLFGRAIPRFEAPIRGESITREHEVSRTNASGESGMGSTVTILRGANIQNMVVRGGRFQVPDDEDDSASTNEDTTNTDISRGSQQ